MFLNISNKIALNILRCLSCIVGQLALRVMYWFILSHGSMLQSVITGTGNANKDLRSGGGKMHPPIKTDMKDKTPSVPNSKSMPQVIRLNMNILKIVPKIRTSFTPVNIIHDFHYVNKYRTFDEVCKLITVFNSDRILVL